MSSPTWKHPWEVERVVASVFAEPRQVSFDLWFGSPEPRPVYAWLCNGHDMVWHHEYCPICDAEWEITYHEAKLKYGLKTQALADWQRHKINRAWQVDEVVLFPCDWTGYRNQDCPDDTHYWGLDVHVLDAEEWRILQMNEYEEV